MDTEGQKHPPQSGLDYLRERLKDWHGSAMAETMNFKLIAVEDGSATFEGFPSPKYYNPQMRLHGGYAATLIDSATGCACYSLMPPDCGYATVETKGNLSRPILHNTGRVRAEARVVMLMKSRSSWPSPSTSAARPLSSTPRLRPTGSPP